MPQPAITEFRGDHAFLSNFYSHPIRWGDQAVPTGEHLFQMLKTTVPEERDQLLKAPTPKDVKRLGRRVTMHPQWDQVRLAAMNDVLKAKFSDPALAQKLIDTGDADLIEGNYWGDTFWGVDLRTGKGLNWLGRLLMLQRARLLMGKKLA